MSLRRRVLILVAAALMAAVPQTAAAAPADKSLVASPSSWLSTFFDWLGDWESLSSVVGMDEIGPGLDPDGSPNAVLLVSDDPGTSSAQPPAGPPDGEIGPDLDPDG